MQIILRAFVTYEDCQAESSVDQSSVYDPAAAIHSLTVSEKSKLNLKKLQLLDYYFSNNIEPSIVSQATQRGFPLETWALNQSKTLTRLIV